ncbi:MAG: alpha/beta hydrolase, partial [Leptospira sp.]|nr:alpha/beta hydrolase [Leptospira sp.]
MSRDISFRSTDGTFIEAVFHEAVNEKSLIIQLPCVGGNALAYRISKKELVNENISLLQFNPRGHGKSEGVLDFSKVRGDFNELYKTFLIRRKGSRLIGVGHSGGGTTLVGFQESLPIFDKIYLIAPILDTGLSLNFMYENKNIDEFIRTAGGNRKPEKLLEEILKNNQWMNREYW